jgi:hypothetical protein
MPKIRAALFTIAFVVGQGCEDRVRNDPCEALLACCESLEGGFASQCREAYERYHEEDGAEQACTDALDSLKSGGACAQRRSDAGTSRDGGPAPTTESREMCSAYVDCVSVTTPEGLGAILATYGANGSCFSTASDETCGVACLTGLQNTRLTHPSEGRCPACFEDAHCATFAGGGSACDQASGTCVECTSDRHCGGATPACRSQSHTCVECTRTDHCPGGTCDLSSFTCQEIEPPCEPESCGEIKAAWLGGGSPTWICGPSPSAACPGATVDCGSCTRGACEEMSSSRLNRCSLVGTTCTPGMSGACLRDEVCTYRPADQGYFCAYDIRGSRCVYGGDSYRCDDRFSCDGANLVNDGICRAYCLSSTDCRTTERCTVYPELGYGVCHPE